MQILALLSLFFLLFPPYLQAEEGELKDIVSSVIIEGQKTMATTTILELIKTKVGDKFSKQTIDVDIKEIYKSGYFEDIKVDLKEDEQGLEITFIVVERPKLKQIVFQGNKEIKKEELEGTISLTANKPFSRPKLNESVNKLTRLYKDKGYYFVKVSTEVSKDEGVVTFKIQEGLKVKIEEINLMGNENFSNFKLRWKMSTGRGDVYKEEELQKDIDKLLLFYKTEGYPLATISQPDVIYDQKKKGLVINISICEGKRFKVEEVKIIGNTIFSNKELLEAIKTKKGDIYNLAKVSLDREMIKSMYLERGYALAQIIPIPEMNAKEARISLIFKIEEGSICYIESIRICGNEKTKEKVIKRELLIKPGDIYDGKRIKQSQQRLINLGFFEEVVINPLSGSTESKKVLNVRVKEGKTGNLLFSLGCGSRGLFGVIEVAKNNLFGKGWSTNLKAERGEKLSNYEFGFTNPWLRDKPTSIGFDIWHKELDDNSKYTEKRNGGNIRLGRPWGTYNKIYLQYKYEQVQMIIGTTTDSTLKEWHENWDDDYVPASSLSTRLVRNTKKGDDIFNPISGYQIDLSNELCGGPLGGRINFYKPMLEVSYFIPSWWKFVLALHIDTGLISSLYKTEDSIEKKIPVYEKFKIGGPKSLRGYEERSVYPKDSSGGNAFLVGNIEYRFPLAESLHGALFFDFGDCWQAGKLNLKYGTGLGIRFKTPIGPISLDFAWRLSDLPRDPLQRKGETELHFSIGPPF